MMGSLNRRDFTRLSALALASGRLRSFAQEPAPAQKPVGYCAIGLGTISGIFSRGTPRTQNSRIVAVVTGHPDTKGKEYAAKFGFPESSIYTYETFDRIRDNKDIDAVYVGLPNSMHREYTLRAAAAGKHVLCEKPMAISSAECRDMIAACKKANVKLMIAYRIHYDPTHREIRRQVLAGDFGDLQEFVGSYGFNSPPGLWRLTKKYGGGGSLMDVGIYPLNEIRWLTGEEPVSFTAQAATRDLSGKFAEVEQSLSFTLKTPSGIIASLSCSYGASVPGFLTICGSRRSIQIPNAFDYGGPRMPTGGMRPPAPGAPPAAAPPAAPPVRPDESFQFALEAEHFSNCIRTNAEPMTGGEEGLKDMIAIEAIYKAAGTPIA
jgi:predicted dehydrogenase